ncbi:hypothetical protein [Pirellulimonas nuda]|nr:hypothetical protein [Pirellulimonas nuda]
MAVFSVAGLLLGYAALVRLKGPSGDFLGLLSSLPAGVRTLLVGNDGSEPSAESIGGPIDSAVRTATFESPSDGPPAVKSLAERMSEPRIATAVEPNRFEPDGETGPVQLTGAPSYGLDELNDAVRGADGATSALIEKSYTSQDDRAEIGASYARLCKTAQVYTFYQSDGDDSQEIVEMEAQDLFRKVFASEHARLDSQTVASRWLAWTGRPHGGVFFAADPLSISRAGSVYEYTFSLQDPEAKEPQEVIVLMTDRHDVRRFSRGEAVAMGVVGCVVERPSEVVPGYTGEAQRAVWIGQGNNAMPLGQAPLP